MKLIFVILSIEASFCLNDCIISISEDGSSTNPEIHWNPLVQKSEVKSLIDGENSESYTVEENVELQVIFLKDKIKIDFFSSIRLKAPLPFGMMQIFISQIQKSQNKS